LDLCDATGETGLPPEQLGPGAVVLRGFAATEAGFEGFVPDACLINRQEPGARLSLHQDRNERDFAQAIVSVSPGIPAVFLFGGRQRADRATPVPLTHGDPVVWGGPGRRRHCVLLLEAAHNALVGGHRINLAFRKAGSLRVLPCGAIWYGLV
jgi:alkylated DNA repair protein (DNA oxidative demethylase)